MAKGKKKSKKGGSGGGAPPPKPAPAAVPDDEDEDEEYVPAPTEVENELADPQADDDDDEQDDDDDDDDNEDDEGLKPGWLTNSLMHQSIGDRFVFAHKLTSDAPVSFDPIHPESALYLMRLELNQIALGPAAKGKTVVACTVLPDEAVDGDIPQPEHCVICTLEPGRTDQCSVDLTFEEDVTFTLISGKGPVYLLGNTTIIDGPEESGSEDDGEDYLDYVDQAQLDRALEEDDALDELDEDDDEEELESSKGKKRGSAALDMPANKRSKSDDEKGLPLDKAMGIVQKIDESKKGYIGSDIEEKDLIANYNKCGGDWDFVLFFQPASDKTDVPRFKKIIAAAQKAGKAKKFSKKETQAIAAKLAESMDEEDLGIDDDDDEDDSEDDDEGDIDMQDFIAEDDEDDDEGDEDADEDDDGLDDEEGGGEEDDDSDDDDDDEDDDDDDDDDEEEDEPPVSTKKASKGAKGAKEGKGKGPKKSRHDELLEDLLKANNTPKKESKFKNFCKNTLKLTDEGEIKELFTAYKAKIAK